VAARAAGAATAGDGAATSGHSAAADPEADASQSAPRTVVTGVAAELREFAKLRDEGILTEEEFTEQKNRLLGR
jgi:predicted Zn-dependent peptidase